MKVGSTLCPLNFEVSIHAGFAENMTKGFWNVIEFGNIDFSILTATKLWRCFTGVIQSLFNPMNNPTVFNVDIYSKCMKRNRTYTVSKGPKNM